MSFMDKVVTSITNAKYYLTGNSTAEKPSVDIDEHTHVDNEDSTTEAAGEVLRGRGASRKRSAEELVDEAGPRKRWNDGSALDRKLAKDHERLADTKQTIHFVRLVGSPERQGSMAVKGYKGGHQPLNTLDKKRHVDPNTGRIGPRSSPRTDSRQHGTKRKDTIASQYWPPGDGFTGNELQSSSVSKKRKLEMGAREASQEPRGAYNNMVDLTENDRNHLRVISTRVTHLEGVPVPTSRTSQTMGTAQTHNLDNAEYSAVSKRMTIEPQRKPRKSKQYSGSSRELVLDSPASPPHEEADPHFVPGHPHPPFLSDNGDESTTSPAVTPRIGSGNKFDQLKPSINLKEGFDDLPPPRKNGRKISQGSAETRAHEKAGIKAEVLIHVERPKSPPLASKFVRVGGTPIQRPLQQQPRSSLQRMERPETRQAKANTDNGESESEDELARATSSIQSPRKATKSLQAARPSTSSSVQSSHLRSAWNQQSQQNQTQSTATRSTRRASVMSPKYSDRVAVNAFYATSCVLLDGDIELMFDKDQKVVFVLRDGSLVRLPGALRALSIGGTESQKLSWSRPRKSGKAILRGSSGYTSNGKICIAFPDIAGVFWLGDRLLEINHDRLRQLPEEEDKFDRMFDNLSREIVQVFDGRRQLQAQRAPATNTESEEIIYEDDQSHQQPTVRQRMKTQEPPRTQQPRRAREDQVEYEVSSYFDRPRRSTRESAPVTRKKFSSPPPLERWTQIAKPKPWPRSVFYPPGIRVPRRVTVDFADLERLDEGEFLNDNVVSFALRRIEETMPAEHKDSVHFFNTFFYTSLTSKDGKKVLNYDAVKRWTKNVDLMSKPYIVVPINANLHWFVAIICNLPNLDRKAVADEDDEDEDLGQAAHGDDYPRRAQEGSANGDVFDSIIVLDSGPPKSSADAVESPAVHDIEATSSPPAGSATKQSKKNRKKAPPRLRKYDTDSPIIITLDSFGSQHTAESRYLKDYIIEEAKEKRGLQVERDQIKGMTAQGIPEQTNFCDCGVYLVGYIEEFAKDPKAFISKVLSREMDREADFAGFDPSAKRAHIRDQLLQEQQQQEVDYKAEKSTKRSAKAAPPPPVTPITPNGHSNRKEARLENTDSARAPVASTFDFSSTHAQFKPAVDQYAHEEDGGDEIEMAVPRPYESSTARTTGRSNPSREEIPDGPAANSDEMLDDPRRAEPPSDSLYGGLDRALAGRAS